MCLFKTPDAPKDPVAPPQYAAQKTPTTQDAQGAGDRTKDRLRAAAGTMLTGGQGVLSSANTTGQKTLLGA